jgi:hypothetical protein
VTDAVDVVIVVACGVFVRGVVVFNTIGSGSMNTSVMAGIGVSTTGVLICSQLIKQPHMKSITQIEAFFNNNQN